MKIIEFKNFSSAEKNTFSPHGFKAFAIKVLGYRVFDIYRHKGFGWFLLFSRYGITWKNLESHPKLFMERFGYKKFIVVNNYLISFMEKL